MRCLCPDAAHCRGHVVEGREVGQGGDAGCPTSPLPWAPRVADMEASELRDLQAPLKQRYREDPTTARTPLHASATFADDGITATVQGWSGPVRAGLHEATGGDGDDACSGDMLLEAVLACAGVTLRSVATAMGLDLGAVRLRADATFDARGTLGLDAAVPVGI